MFTYFLFKVFLYTYFKTVNKKTVIHYFPIYILKVGKQNYVVYILYFTNDKFAKKKRLCLLFTYLYLLNRKKELMVDTLIYSVLRSQTICLSILSHAVHAGKVAYSCILRRNIMITAGS